MKKQLTAMILAASAAFMGVSFGVFADVAPTQPSKIDIANGSVSITNTQITYYRDSGNAVVQVTEPVKPTGYIIEGTQTATPLGAPNQTLQINGATVPLTLTPAVGTTFQIGGDMRTSAPVTLGGAVNIGGNLITNAAFNANGALNVGGNLLTNAAFTANGTLNVAGNLEAKSVLLINRSYSAVPVILNAPATIGGNVVADNAFAANGVATTVQGDMTVQGLLTNKGQLTVKKNLTLSVPPVLQGGVATVGNMTIQTGDFTAAVPITAGGTLQTKAGSMTLNVPVSAGQISSSGNLLLNASATTGSLSSGADMALKAPTHTGSITAGGALMADNVQVQTTAGGISAKNALDLGGSVIAAGPITSTAGIVTLRGPSSATGAISGVQVDLKGVTNAASISATGGNVTADVPVTVSGDIQATGSMLFRQTAKAGGNIQAQGNGTITFNGAADAGQTINSNQGSVFAQGDLRAWAVQAPNGAIDLRGNVTVQNSILARDALSIAGTADTGLISSAAGTVTLGGNTTATTGVHGARVMVNNGAWLKTPTLNTPATATNRFAVDVNTPFVAGTSVTVRATGVNAMPATIGAVRSAGLRLWLPAGHSVVTVQDSNNRSYLGNVQVQTSATPSRLTLNSGNTNSPAGGGGSGGVGGSDSFDEDDFWDDVVDRIKSARSGDEIRLSASKVDHMPVWVLKELDGRNVTLRVSHGSVTVALNGKKLPSIPGNKIFYQFDALKEWYEDGQEPESSSSQTSSAKPSVPLPPASSSTPQVVTPPPASSVAPPKPSSSSSEESSSALEEPSSSEESSSEEEVIADAEEEQTPPEPEKTKRPILPLVIAGVVASLAAAGAVIGYLLYRRKTEEYLDDNRQDPPELPM